MSQENVDTVRRVFDGWARGDFSEGDVFHPEVEFELVDWPEPARTRGVDAMRRAWLATLSAWDDYRSVPG
jgi:ketosteroid isomerase-like protein